MLLIRKYDEKELLRIATTGKIESSGTSKETSIKSVSSDKQIYEILKSLDKWRVGLTLEQILIAITPWFHVHISKRQMHRLGPIEIDAVTKLCEIHYLKKLRVIQSTTKVRDFRKTTGFVTKMIRAAHANHQSICNCQY